MNPPSALDSPRPRVTPADWDQLRREFRRSLMVDTSLASLAENIDGCVWSIRGPEETPAAYIDLPHVEALARLASLKLPPTALDRLVDILRGTLVFDESFGEMVDIAGKAEADHDPVPRNLERLGIPLDFPVSLCAFKPGTMDFCRRERIAVIADFLSFSRGASRQVIIGGEFRDLLNAITHIDENTIAHFLPYRVKTSGLYLVEGLAHLVRDLSDAQRQQLVTHPETLAPELRAQGEHLANYFGAQLQEMRSALAAGTPLSRLVAPLDHLVIEPAVASILRLYLKPAAPVAPVKPVRPGFFRRLFGLG